MGLATEADVAIWTLRMDPGAQWTLPAAQGQGTRRMLYFFAGEGLRVDPQDVGQHAALELVANQDWPLTNTGATPVECLLLQGQPSAEPVAQYGPFVMNTQREIMQAMQDYRRTQFGGPWPESDPVHGGTAGVLPATRARAPGNSRPQGRDARWWTIPHFPLLAKKRRMNITKDTAVTITYKVTTPQGKPLDAATWPICMAATKNIFPRSKPRWKARRRALPPRWTWPWKTPLAATRRGPGAHHPQSGSRPA